MKFLRWALPLLAVLAWHDASHAVILYSSGLDSLSNWTVIADPDTAIEFGFDYSSMGIPPAPGATDTIGLRMAANIQPPNGAAALAASPNGLSLTGQYQVSFDFWINYTSPGTTEHIGGFAGFNAADNSAFSGAGLLGDSDGDTSGDYRFYADTTLVSSLNNTDPPVNALMGGSTPALQLDVNVFDPPNDDLTAPAGALGFAWHQMVINANTDAGKATFFIDGIEIGSVDTDVAGGIALTYVDFFGSVAGDPRFAFGLFDNLVVTDVPEPSSFSLLGLAGLILARVRRRG